MNGNPTIISLFAGCGGSSLGYKWAGYDELLAIEFDKYAAEQFHLNFPDVLVWQKNIRNIEALQILQICNLKIGELDILDGSPPCQGFSTANNKRQVTDTRNDLSLEFTRILKEIQPKAFVMENVSGLVKGKMKGIFKEIIIKLEKCGYNVKCRLMNAKYYGVAQNRQRLIWIGFRNDLNISPSYPIPQTIPKTVREAFLGLPLQKQDNIESILIQNLWQITKQGDNFLDASLKQLGRRSYFTCYKLAWDKPSNTICARGGLYHPDECRKITISEVKRLCSFPDDFKLNGNINNQIHVVGNAVPPLMMKAIAEHIKGVLKNNG